MKRPCKSCTCAMAGGFRCLLLINLFPQQRCSSTYSCSGCQCNACTNAACHPPYVVLRMALLAGQPCLPLELNLINTVHCRALLDAQLEEVFGTSDLNSGKILTLTEFLHCLHASQVKQLLNRVTARSYVSATPCVLAGLVCLLTCRASDAALEAWPSRT